MLTQQFAAPGARSRILIFALLIIAAAYAGWRALLGDWLNVAASAVGTGVLVLLAGSPAAQMRILREPFNRRHAAYVVMLWVYLIAWVNVARALGSAPPLGKNSALFYTLAIALVMLTIMLVRALALLSYRFSRPFVTDIPVWEQALVAINEFVAAGLLALYAGNTLVQVFQPDVFTIRLNLPYTAGVGAVAVLYYGGMQLMWLARWNSWLSKNRVWVGLARTLSPLVLLVITMAIVARFAEQGDPRTASLLGSADTDVAVLAFAPVIWLLTVVVMLLVYTGRSGLRQRFLPDVLLDQLPPRLNRFLRTISDMDMLLILGVLATVIPAYLFLLGDTSGIIGALRGEILERGSVVIETSEQALALLFAMPFYVVIVGVLLIYALALARPSVSAYEREELVRRLPIGFLIILIITLFLFTVPFTQVLTEGRLPRLPQDLGRILLFNVLIPLLLLYAHYFLLVRLPYGRGQSAWREAQAARLSRRLEDVERRIESLNREVEALDRLWRDGRAADPGANVDLLYRYVQLNSMRDDTNMQRLQVLAERQQLAEVSETPVSLAVARLPVRIVSIGIPLLVAIQIYQWAVLNNGLREIINDPNITIFEFFRAILQQAQF
jgi:hypothetical protein